MPRFDHGMTIGIWMFTFTWVCASEGTVILSVASLAISVLVNVCVGIAAEKGPQSGPGFVVQSVNVPEPDTEASVTIPVDVACVAVNEYVRWQVADRWGSARG